MSRPDRCSEAGREWIVEANKKQGDGDENYKNSTEIGEKFFDRVYDSLANIKWVLFGDKDLLFSYLLQFHQY